MSEPQPGWALDAALDLLAQGYTVESTAERSGFHPAHLRGAARARGLRLRLMSGGAKTHTAATRIGNAAHIVGLGLAPFAGPSPAQHRLGEGGGRG